MTKSLTTLLLCLLYQAGLAEQNLTQTKLQLNALNTTITSLQQTLTHAHGKEEGLHLALLQTEKKISTTVYKLHTMRINISQKQRQLEILQEQLNTLNHQLQHEQSLLSKHLYTRYAMGQYQPLKWILNQDNPETMSRVLTFYEYIVQSRQHLIDRVKTMTLERETHQQQVHQVLEEQHQLQVQWTTTQQQLEKNKQHHLLIIHALNQNIKNTQQTLLNAQKNKEALSIVLNTLVQQSIQQSQRPLLFLNHTLPRPVQVTDHQIHPLNQGLVFYAKEGTPVSAISPGKVVFCDWLNGYGLLLILDHGRGFMTLYAHNQSLFKQKGAYVQQGEQIATVGHSGGLKENGLYFEIRQRGKAISPRRWLS